MAGGTFQGLLWLEGRPSSIRSRTCDPIGSGGPSGSLMFIAHLLFAWNFFSPWYAGNVVTPPLRMSPTNVVPSIS